MIGRITDTGTALSDEDRFNAAYNQDYVDFIKDRPWYEFDFKSRLKSLWQMPLSGSHFFRKIERRYILTSELLVKVAYGKLIGMGTKTVYEQALPTTAVVVDSLPAALPGVPFRDRYLFADGSGLLYLPRYDRFNPAVCDLAKSGCRFKEIAGNTSGILLTLLVKEGQQLSFPESRIIFTQPLVSEPGRRRVAIVTPVPHLHNLLNAVQSAGSNISVEHVFDF